MSAGRFGSMSVVGGMTMTSRVLGLLREVVFARFFGASATMDVFVVAFQIPNFLRRLFAEGAFSQAFVPVVSEYRETRSREEVRELADRATGSLASVLLVLTVIGVVAAPLLIWLLPGDENDASRLLLMTVAATSTCVLAAFVFPPTDEETLVRFYGRVRPPGFWGPIARRAQMPIGASREAFKRGVLATALASLSVFALIIGFGNGLGSGTMLTLSTDLAPGDNPAEFLGALRLLADGGRILGPLVVGVVADQFDLGAAAIALGLVGLATVALFVGAIGEPSRAGGSTAN